MIHLVSGVLIEKEPEFCLIEAGGVGYGIHITKTAHGTLPEPGGEARLWTYLHVREAEMSLYGFASRNERDAFEILLGASGVGPRIALSMLSAFPIDQLAQAIVSGDVATLSRINGIGRKKAEKLIVELRGRLAKFVAPVASGAIATRLMILGPANEAQEQAVQALVSLGATQTEARLRVAEAVRQAGGSASVETLISTAMRTHR